MLPLLLLFTGGLSVVTYQHHQAIKSHYAEYSKDSAAIHSQADQDRADFQAQLARHEKGLQKLHAAKANNSLEGIVPSDADWMR
jgi:hypothetical protein